MAHGVIFDVDGTLIDSVDFHARAWHEAFESFGVQAELARVRTQIGKGGDKLMREFLSENQIERQGKQIEDARTKIFKREYLPQVKPFPRLHDLFARLKSDGRKIALASSAKKDELEEYKRITGIEPYLEADTSSDDVANSKPDPDIFLAARKKLGLDARLCVAVGDTPYDAESAGRAGMGTIGLLCGGWDAATLRKAGCVAVYAGPAELCERYDASPLARSGE